MRIQMCCAAAVMVGLFLGDFSYAEGLVFHYDPDTGNVSFDTSETRNGSTMLFSLSLHTTCEGSTSNLGGSRMTDEEFALCEATRVSTSGVEFRPENYIALSQSSISESTNFQVGEATFAQPWSGVYSIGEILPPGLDESTWTSLFRNNTGGGRRYPDSGTHIYTDVVGGGNPVPAEFVYGRPDVEYDNRWDLVDPDSLDWAEQAKLIYRQSTGELIFDTSGDSGGYSTSFLIRSSGGDLLHENFESPFESSFEHINSSNGVILLGDAIEPGKSILDSCCLRV